MSAQSAVLCGTIVYGTTTSFATMTTARDSAQLSFLRRVRVSRWDVQQTCAYGRGAMSGSQLNSGRRSRLDIMGGAALFGYAQIDTIRSPVERCIAATVPYASRAPAREWVCIGAAQRIASLSTHLNGPDRKRIHTFFRTPYCFTPRMTSTDRYTHTGKNKRRDRNQGRTQRKNKSLVFGGEQPTESKHQKGKRERKILDRSCR